MTLSQAAFAQSSEPPALIEIVDVLYLDPSRVVNDSLQRLNLVKPAGADTLPLLLWIGGGAWSYGDRAGEMDMARRFAQEGMVVAVPGHRLSPAVWRDSSLTRGVRHPAHIEDVAAAFRWLYDRAGTYGIDRTRITVGGYSSGGHLAALLSMDERYLAAEGLTRETIQGVVPIAGTYDIAAYHQAFLEGNRPELAELHVEAVFGDAPGLFTDASPTSYVGDMVVPMLLVSETDTYEYTRIFETAIKEAGFQDLTVVHVREYGHGAFWRHLWQASSSSYREAIVSFIVGDMSPVP